MCSLPDINGMDSESSQHSPDILVEHHGSIVLLRPVSEAGRAWVEEHIDAGNGYQPYWPTVVCEPRFVADIIDGMRADGLQVRL